MVAILLHICLIFSVFIPTSESQRQVRNVITGRNREWRRGDVIYRFSSLFDNSQRLIVTEAMQEIMNDTSYHSGQCVRFLPREGVYSSDDDFVYFTDSPDSGCSVPSVGRRGGQQDVLIGSNCMTKTGIMPLLLLTLGLYREHQRPDRDQYINVHYTNIKKEDLPLFDKIDPASTDLLGLRYDYNSITHFGPYAYAVDLHIPTITTNASNISFGNKKKLSVTDVEKVQNLYNCGIDTSHIVNHPPYPVECHFEQEMCNMADDFTDDFQWLRQDTPLGENGPSGDHSTGQGYYLFANGTSHLNKIARLLTAREIPPGDYCISLHYYIDGGDGAAMLAVNIFDYNLGHESHLANATTNSGSQSDGLWYLLQRNYSNLSHKWRLLVEGTILNEQGGVALDDVVVYPGVCS